MELIQRLCERDILNRTKKHSLENLASKQKLSGLLKSRRCAWHRRNHASNRAITPAHVGTFSFGSHELASSRVAVFGEQVMSWWSQPGSNRRPSGCKPDALPAELWPLPETWWVWEELHPRPHPYQGCALTN